jgi:2-polyprenyl-6-methoxyphenol hydroxylase-like FAD-dependent oxidoreductase
LQNRFGVSVELGTELGTFNQDERFVTASLAKRPAGGNRPSEETVQVPYMVGCDGGKSWSFVRILYLILIFWL